MPYYGPSLSHAIGDIAVIMGLFFLVTFPRHISRTEIFLPFCGGYGALIVYLEFLTGQLPTAAGLLFVAGYLLRRLNEEEASDPRVFLAFATAGVLAFGLGAGLTVALKQVLAVAVIGADAFAQFSEAFQLRTSSPIEEGRMHSVLALLRRFLRAEAVLTHGNLCLLLVAYGAAASAWGGAVVLALRQRERYALYDLAAFLLGASMIVGWLLVFSQHAYTHNWMSRLLIVPISLGFAALMWQLRLRALPASSSATKR